MASTYDFIRSATIILGTGYTAQQDRKTWMWGDSCLWGAYGVGLFLFPEYLFPGSQSAMMSYLVRVFASLILGMECMVYLCRKSRDESVIGTTLWARLLSSLFLIIVLFHGYVQNTDKFSYKTLYFDVEVFLLLFVTSVFQFWRGSYRIGGRDQKGHVSTVLRIVFLITFLTGILDITFPSWVIPFKKLESLETVMMRANGAMFLGISFIALYATSFRFDEDRSHYFLSTMLTCGLMLVSLNVSYFMDSLFNSQEALIMHIGCIPVFILMLGLYLLWKQSNDSVNNSDYFLRSSSKSHVN